MYVCASLRDILRRFKKSAIAKGAIVNVNAYEDFPEKVSFLVLDAYCAGLAIIELLRILLDEEELSF